MKKLRIGQISPLNLPIPPAKYGGTEKIIYALCQQLTKKGHQVFLFGTSDSKVDCHLIPIIKKALWKSKIKDSSPYYAYEMAVVAKKAKELNLDIIHDHLGPRALTLYGQVDIPVIHTLHVPFRNKDRIWAYKKLNSKLVSISEAQRRPAPELNYVATIYNGINIEKFAFNSKPQEHFIWVGELSPRKGIYEVIQIAKQAKIKLVLAGRIPPPRQGSDYTFFQKYIRKELNKDNIGYLGEQTPDELSRLYQSGKAFLYPLQWEEPFGLTMVESMACGTPVIAFNRGSVVEVVRDGVTGFVVEPLTKEGKTNIEGFIRAIKKVDKIDRRKCRQRVEERFTMEAMVGEYEKLYYKVIGSAYTKRQK